MSIEWETPSKGTVLSTLSSALGIYATRNEFIGWGPHAANALRTARDHPDAALALLVAAGLLIYSYWRPLIRMFGFREKPGPLWVDDRALANGILGWMRDRVTVTDHTAEVARSNPELSFNLSIEALDKRHITVAKVKGSASVQLSARIVPSGVHEPVIRAMTDSEYREMQDEISVELVKIGVQVVITSRILADRGRATDDQGNELPVGVFIGEQIPVATLTLGEFINSLNSMRRGTAIAQALVRKHVRTTSGRLGQAIAPDPTSELTILPTTTAILSSSPSDQSEEQSRG